MRTLVLTTCCSSWSLIFLGGRYVFLQDGLDVFLQILKLVVVFVELVVLVVVDVVVLGIQQEVVRILVVFRLVVWIAQTLEIDPAFLVNNLSEEAIRFRHTCPRPFYGKTPPQCSWTASFAAAASRVSSPCTAVVAGALPGWTARNRGAEASCFCPWAAGYCSKFFIFPKCSFYSIACSDSSQVRELGDWAWNSTCLTANHWTSRCLWPAIHQIGFYFIREFTFFLSHQT